MAARAFLGSRRDGSREQVVLRAVGRPQRGLERETNHGGRKAQLLEPQAQQALERRLIARGSGGEDPLDRTRIVALARARPALGAELERELAITCCCAHACATSPRRSESW